METDTNLSLDAFQSRFTSEDNASFSQIVAKANEAKREQFAWMYEHEKQQQARLLQGSAQASALRITASSAETEKGQTDSSEMILKDGTSSLDSLEPAIRSMNSTTVSLETVKIDSWKHKARNALIFEPQGAPLTMADVAQSKGPQKTISHSATRFAMAPPSSLDVTRTEGQTASPLTRLATQEVWRNMAQQTPSLFPQSSSTPGKFDSATGEYSFVESTPLLVPGEAFDPSELMTWGYIEGTPILVDQQHPSATPKQFKIPPTPKRDALGLRLAESVGKKSVAARSISQGSGSLASLSQRTLSPAAHRLLSGSRLGKAVGLMGHTSGATSSLPTARTSTTPIILGRTDSQLRASYASSTPGRGVVGTGKGMVSRSASRAPGSSSSTRPTRTTSAMMRTTTLGDARGATTAPTPIRPSSHLSNISVNATRLDPSSDKKDLTDNLLQVII